jgi:hypothetical protein
MISPQRHREHGEEINIRREHRFRFELGSGLRRKETVAPRNDLDLLSVCEPQT